MESSKPKNGYKKLNLKILFSYFAILILVQAVGLYLLFNNLNFNSVIIGAVAIGFLGPLLIALIFIVYTKSLKKIS